MEIRIHPNIISQYEFLMMDLDPIIRFTKDNGVLKRQLDEYWNKYIKTHKEVEDLAAFAMALNHTGLKFEISDERYTIFANLCAKTTAHCYENLSEDDAVLFHDYID